MQNRVAEILFASLRYTMFGGELPVGMFEAMSAEEWKGLFRMSAKQGVLAIVYEVVSQLPREMQPPRQINLRWAVSVEAIENRYDLQRRTSALLAEMFAEQGLQTVVMKGLAMGTYYPEPRHREFGDLDCFLGEGYEQANQICEQLGAKVDRGYYKDAVIRYRGLLVENHRFFLPIRGSRQMKAFERYLEGIAVGSEVRYVDDTKLIIPSPLFNALFLTMHGVNHFVSEGIKLRHILDWALLLKAEQHNIDWKEFYAWADRMHLTRFANALTAISIERFGLKVEHPDIVTASPYAERILKDCLQSDTLFNKGYSAWRGRFVQIKNRITSSWRYHKIYQKSVVVEIIRSVWAFFFERNPQL